MGFEGCTATTCCRIWEGVSFAWWTQTTFYHTVWDRAEGGHHWLTVCREKDHVLVFDSFGRNLEQMEQDYTEPNLKQFFLDAFPDCRISTNTQVIQDRSTAVCGRYAILVGQLFSKGGTIENVLQQLGEMFSSDTLTNDRRIMEGGGVGKWTNRLAQELHKPRRVRFQRRKVNVKGVDQVCWFSRHECFFRWQSRCQVSSHHHRRLQQVCMDHAIEIQDRERYYEGIWLHHHG